MPRLHFLSLALLLTACGAEDPNPADASLDDVADAAPDTDAVDIAEDSQPDAESDLPDATVDTPVDSSDASDAVAEVDAGPAGCDPTGGEAGSFGIGAWTITLEEDGAWSVTPPDAVLPTFYAPPTCADDGRSRVRVARGEPHVLNEFGAFRIALESRQSTLNWVSADGPPSLEDSAFVYLANGRSVRLRFSESGRDLRVELEGGWQAGELIWSLGAEESYFGLGTQVTGMDLRGRNYPLWTQEQGNGKPEDPVAWPLQGEPEAAYAPMGVWHSSGGFSALLTHDAYSELDIGKRDEAEVSLRSYPELPGFVLVDGTTPRARLARITEYTGRLPEDPPAWTFAPWNDAVGGPERLREVARILRENQIPSSAIWSEDWIGGEQTGTGYRLSYVWEWSEETYPELPEDIAWLHENGFAFLAYFNTFVPDPTRMWTEGVEGDFLMRTADGEPRTVVDPAFRTAGLVDLSNEAAADWFRAYMTTAAEMGIDGWMADFTEWAPVDVALADGSDPWLFHNRYPLRFQEVAREALSGAHADVDGEAPNNWTYFARSGWASVNGGTGGIAPTLWGGDQNTNWEYDDGYPTVVPIAAHVGLSGVPVFGSDVAGYNALFGTPTSKELFYRWSAMAAFHGLMRTHHGSNECANWSFDRDSETLDHYRRYASIHTLLFPVFEGLVADARTEGLPLVRHPFLVSPGARWLWQGEDYQFFLGDDLLVAPVLQEAATTRTVGLPDSGWWPLFGDAPLEVETVEDGSRSATVEAPATELPVFVRPGTALPLLGEAVDSFYGASEESVSDLADVDTFRLALYPDEAGAIRPVSVGGADVSAEGWLSPDWASATYNEEALLACESVESGVSCVSGSRARLFGEGTLRAGDASATVTGLAPTVSLWIGVAGSAWTPWDAPTTLTDLAPDIPPPCEEQ